MAITPQELLGKRNDGAELLQITQRSTGVSYYMWVRSDSRTASHVVGEMNGRVYDFDSSNGYIWRALEVRPVVQEDGWEVN